MDKVGRVILFVLASAIGIFFGYSLIEFDKQDISVLPSAAKCEFVYERNQVLYHDLMSFVEKLIVEETVKVVDSEGNETCLYKFYESSLYFTQEVILKGDYMETK